MAGNVLRAATHQPGELGGYIPKWKKMGRPPRVTVQGLHHLGSFPCLVTDELCSCGQLP